jgi:carbonic anhydrase
MTFDNSAARLKGWHIHAPACHSVQATVPKPSSTSCTPMPTLRIDPSNAQSAFFSQFPAVPGFYNQTAHAMQMDDIVALKEVNIFNEF